MKPIVEAEITSAMPLQKPRDAESRVRNKLSNEPLRIPVKARIFLQQYTVVEERATWKA